MNSLFWTYRIAVQTMDTTIIRFLYIFRQIKTKGANITADTALVALFFFEKQAVAEHFILQENILTQTC